MTIELAILENEDDISEHWTDEDYRDFSDASFALIEARLNEEASENSGE